MFFILFIGLIGLWIRSMLPLLGSFKDSIGNFTGGESVSFFSVEKNDEAKIELINQNGDSNGGNIMATVIFENYPTYTPYPTFTAVPTSTPVPGNVGAVLNKAVYQVKGYYSYYWPPLGGINCDKNLDGSPECEYISNGDPYTQWVSVGFACPLSVPFGSKIHIEQLNINGICVDRGGMIVIDEFGYYWFDHLIENPLIKYGSEIDVIITLP